jgi:hypothetical protein
MALGRGKLQPARGLMRIRWCAAEVKPPEFVLRIGIASQSAKLPQMMRLPGVNI